MQKLLLSFGILLVLSVTFCLAKNNPCPLDKPLSKKQVEKVSNKTLSDKILKGRPANDCKNDRSINESSNQSKSSADTFDSLIVPFIKTVAPHFYDQIIKREPKNNTAHT